jgi:SNF2 family DNA or RNA helicase
MKHPINLCLAHVIRNSATKQSQATCELSAGRRWCVTGTPIQNSASDIGSLFTFLQYQPLCQKPIFNRYVMTPLNARQHHGIHNLRAALKPVYLRRTKDTISQHLPVRREFIQYLTFSPSEKRLYEEHAKKFTSLPSKIEHTAETFRQLLTLRLICDHGYDLLNSSRKEQCFEMRCFQCSSYMADEAAGYTKQACIHRLLCRDCIEINQESSDTELSDQDICIKCQVESRISTNELFSSYQGPSTKVQAIIEAITNEFTEGTATPIKQYVPSLRLRVPPADDSLPVLYFPAGPVCWT